MARFVKQGMYYAKRMALDGKGGAFAEQGGAFAEQGGVMQSGAHYLAVRAGKTLCAMRKS